MSSRNYRLVRWSLFGLLGAIVAVAIGIITNLVTANPQNLFSPENRQLWMILAGLVVLAVGIGVWERWLEANQNVEEAQVPGDSNRPESSKLSQSEIRNRQALLDKVRNSWIEGVLERSLYSKARIALGLEERPDAVHPWTMGWVPNNQPRQTLETGTKIIKKLDALGEGATLLILGEPGAGKTTMLLELAKDLILRTKANSPKPVPVVLNLSSWGSGKQTTLQEWLVEELNSKYQVPRKLGQTWLEQEQLILLLDGLDEVNQGKRSACVEAMNLISQDHGTTALVVCSRLGDYEALKLQLRFQAALFVEPLTPKQVDDYLQKAGAKLAGIRTALKADPELQQPDPGSLLRLSASPLFLSIMLLAYEGMSASEILQMGVQNQRKHLFDRYIERMFERRRDDPRYPRKKAQHWLKQLAQQMVVESQTIFLIERMRVSWLTIAFEQEHYRLIYRLAIVLIYRLIVGLIFGLIVGLILGLAIWLIVRLNLIEYTEIRQSPVSREACCKIIKDLTRSLIGGLTFGLIGGLTFGLVGQFIEEEEFDATVMSVPNQRIWQSAKNAALLMLIIPLSLILFGAVLHQISIRVLSSSEVFGRLFLIWFFVLCFAFYEGGGTACSQHFVLRLLLWKQHRTPWNYARFLDYAAEQVFLQKVGGGYIFVHRLLMEHFAQLEID